MFTGIIEATAPVLEKNASGLTIGRPEMFDDVRRGSSIAISGVCLTVASLDRGSLTFDVVPETWSNTTLGLLRPAARVNLERSFPVTGRFDGHIVQGHVEGVGRISAVRGTRKITSSNIRLVVRLPRHLLHCILPKGSIALDGVSLTVVSLEGDRVTVALIPETRARTTLGEVQKGDAMNVETDILGRMVWRYFRTCLPGNLLPFPESDCPPERLRV